MESEVNENDNDSTNVIFATLADLCEKVCTVVDSNTVCTGKDENIFRTPNAPRQFVKVESLSNENGSSHLVSGPKCIMVSDAAKGTIPSDSGSGANAVAETDRQNFMLLENNYNHQNNNNNDENISVANVVPFRPDSSYSDKTFQTSTHQDSAPDNGVENSGNDPVSSEMTKVTFSGENFAKFENTTTEEMSVTSENDTHDVNGDCKQEGVGFPLPCEKSSPLNDVTSQSCDQDTAIHASKGKRESFKDIVHDQDIDSVIEMDLSESTTKGRVSELNQSCLQEKSPPTGNVEYHNDCDESDDDDDDADDDHDHDEVHVEVNDLEFVLKIVEQDLKEVDKIKNSDPLASHDRRREQTFIMQHEYASDVGSSSTDTKSSSDESDASSESEDTGKKYRKNRICMEDDEDVISTAPPRTKDEVLFSELPPPKPVDIVADERMKIKPLGTIDSILYDDATVIIKSLAGVPAIDCESVLFLEDGTGFGEIEDIFGPVSNPYYCVRFISAEDIQAKKLTIGQTVYYATNTDDLTHFVFVSKLKSFKGSDASWKHDQEPPEEVKEYSDDEEEAKARTAKRKANRLKKRKQTQTQKENLHISVDERDLPNPPSSQTHARPFKRPPVRRPKTQPQFQPLQPAFPRPVGSAFPEEEGLSSQFLPRSQPSRHVGHQMHHPALRTPHVDQQSHWYQPYQYHSGASPPPPTYPPPQVPISPGQQNHGNVRSSFHNIQPSADQLPAPTAHIHPSGQLVNKVHTTRPRWHEGHPPGHQPRHPSNHVPVHPPGHPPGYALNQPPGHLPGHLPIHPSGHPLHHPPGYNPNNPPSHPPGHPPNYSTGHPPNYPPDHHPNYQPGHLPGYPSNYQPGYPSSNPPGHPPNHLPVYPAAPTPGQCTWPPT